MDKKYCIGCRQNFYNGNNNLGVKECWSREEAKLVWRIRIGHWETPPYKKKKELVASCYRTESQGDHFIDPDKSLDSKGYWK